MNVFNRETLTDKYRLRREQKKRMLTHLQQELPITEKQAAEVMRLGFIELIGRQRLPGEFLSDEDLRMKIYADLEAMEVAP